MVAAGKSRPESKARPSPDHQDRNSACHPSRDVPKPAAHQESPARPKPRRAIESGRRAPPRRASSGAQAPRAEHQGLVGVVTASRRHRPSRAPDASGDFTRDPEQHVASATSRAHHDRPEVEFSRQGCRCYPSALAVLPRTSGPVAQFGSALPWHGRGPGFKSPSVHPAERLAHVAGRSGFLSMT